MRKARERNRTVVSDPEYEDGYAAKLVKYIPSGVRGAFIQVVTLADKWQHYSQSLRHGKHQPRSKEGVVRPRRLVLAVLPFALLLGACGASETTKNYPIRPTPPRTEIAPPLETAPSTASTPTGGNPSLHWSDVNGAVDDVYTAYAQVCQGNTLADSARYAGSDHPLAIIGPPNGGPYQGRGGWEQEMAEYIGESAPSGLLPRSVDDIQLVACVASEKTVPATSCGIYKRVVDGVTGEVRRTTSSVKVRIIVARTGRQVAQETLLGQPMQCAEQFMTGDPPWVLEGGPVLFVCMPDSEASETCDKSAQAARSYLVGLTTGPAR